MAIYSVYEQFTNIHNIIFNYRYFTQYKWIMFLHKNLPEPEKKRK